MLYFICLLIGHNWREKAIADDGLTVYKSMVCKRCGTYEFVTKMKDMTDEFRRAWIDALNGNTFPIDTLRDEIISSEEEQ